MDVSSCMVAQPNHMLHPFFSRQHDERGIDDVTETSRASVIQKEQVEQPTIDSSHPNSLKTEQAGCERGIQEVAAAKTKQSVISNTFTLEAQRSTLEFGHDGTHDVQDGPRKRRRVSRGPPSVVQQTDSDAVGSTVVDLSASPGAQTAEVTVVAVDASSKEGVRTPPRKMLRLSGSGKFSSPPTRTGKQDSTLAAEPRKRGRPKKVQQSIDRKHLIATIRYAVTECSVGQKINDILSGQLRLNPVPETPKRNSRKSKVANHPFFQDKAKPTRPLKLETPRKAAAVTPGKLRTQTRPEVLHTQADHVYESALLKDRHIMKHVGAREAQWPSKDMVHVRAIECETPRAELRVTRGKLKGVQRPIPPHQSMLVSYSRQLRPQPDATTRPDGFKEPDASLAIPDRLLMTGVDICNAIVKEIIAPLRQGPPDELALPSASQTTVHPALAHVFSSIPAYLSGFDELRGEESSLVSKHAPTCAAEVLQPLGETSIIKTWLQALTINTVGTTTSAPQVEQEKHGKRKRKRKTRPEDLDDFIVDEDDDIGSMVTVSDTESADLTSLRSVVQTQIKGVRASNALLISGPHGCGKTAAIYAVAKELGFRVFEISSAERRTGKDVLDKIGNVTENHIVKQHAGDEQPKKSDIVTKLTRDEEAEKSGADDSARIEAALVKDIESGRQGKMSAFFKPKIAKATGPPAKKEEKSSATAKKSVINALQKVLKKPPKEQQQSLILLEEVDILFKEDKDFWNVVLRLITSSKRPFILTCNDEDLVPIQALRLHAILRFNPPATDLAVDYLLLLAAKEGHLLQRSAVKQLWESTGQDLRKSLNSLDFWCRMGVGDIRDGLTWMYQRWPIGTDVDQNGRKIRVVSRETLHPGLDGLSTVEDPNRSLFTTTTLGQFERLAATSSDIDVFSSNSDLDSTLPELTDKQRLHYIDGMQLLDVKLRPDYSGLTEAMQVFALRLLSAEYPGSELLFASVASERLSRKAFAVFDGLANPVHSSSTSTGMEISVFDGPLAPIAADVAPYVRQILRYDLMLEAQRDLLTGPIKKARKTRAALSALEGGQRQLVRRRWWWEGVGDLHPVLATAGDSWADVERAAMDEMSR